MFLTLPDGSPESHEWRLSQKPLLAPKYTSRSPSQCYWFLDPMPTVNINEMFGHASGWPSNSDPDRSFLLPEPDM